MKQENPFVDIIYTFNGQPQQRGKKEITQAVLNSKELFFMLLTCELSEKEKETLCKISCCVYWAEKLDMDAPKWYNEQNGKFYDDEIPALIKTLYGIECTYEPVNK